MKLTFILAACVFIGAILSPLPWLAVTVAVAVIAAVVLDRRVLFCLKRPSLWGIFLLITVGQPLLLGSPDAVFAGIPYSTASLAAGIGMSLRGVLMIVLFGFVSVRMRHLSMAGMWSQIGLHEFAEAFAQAEMLLPRIERSLRHSYQDFHAGRRSGQKGVGVVNSMATVLASILKLSRQHAAPVQPPPEGV